MRNFRSIAKFPAVGKNIIKLSHQTAKNNYLFLVSLWRLAALKTNKFDRPGTAIADVP